MSDLGFLYDTHIALVMFSPTGEVINYSSRERSTPNPNEEAHMEKLNDLKQTLSEAHEKIRLKISSLYF
uniref:Uncharacterized protein n=1 Tax=Solanum lycopersicum TaxID=4081 RepID=A0A3Q7GUG3_SOLLC